MIVDQPETANLLYPFFYRPMYNIVEDGWTAFTTESEFSKLVLNSEEWRISHVNKDYTVPCIELDNIKFLRFVSYSDEFCRFVIPTQQQ